LLFLAFCAAAQPRPAPYYPDAPGSGERPRKRASTRQRLKDAIDFAVAAESRNPRDLTLNHYRSFGASRTGRRSVRSQDRGDPTGVVVHKGYIVAEWRAFAAWTWTHS